MKFEVLKGTRDIECEEQIIVNKIVDIIRKNFERYGFRPFDTPIIEFFDILSNKYDLDAEIIQEIFKLSDRGDRNLGLRYDLTVPLCRYVASKKQLKLPFKRYQIGKVFRDGPIKKGRLREFMQFDGDVIGIKGQEIEAEILDLFFRTYKNLGLSVVIEINNMKILKGVLLQVGFEKKDLSILILSLDKLKKIGEKGVLKEIREKGFDCDKVESVIKILSLKSVQDIKIVSENDVLKEGIEEIEKLVSLIDGLKIDYRINFSMSRGLDIYTSNVWEVYDKYEKITSSLGSGGRYDRVIGSFAENGKEFPAVGISFGIIPIMEVIEREENVKLSDVLIVPLNDKVIDFAFKIANKFRSEGKNTEINYSYKLKKAFDYAENLKIEDVVIFGEKEVKEKKFKIKNLESGKEREFKL